MTFVLFLDVLMKEKPKQNNREEYFTDEKWF